jgi:hypothetical protein
METWKNLEEPGRETEYAEESSRELESIIMCASYKQPTSDDCETSGRPESLFMATGFWLIDTNYCGRSRIQLDYDI